MSVCFGNLCMCPSKPFLLSIVTPGYSICLSWHHRPLRILLCEWQCMCFTQFFRSIPGMYVFSCNLRELLRGEFLWSFKVAFTSSSYNHLSVRTEKRSPSGMALSHLRCQARERLRNRKMSLVTIHVLRLTSAVSLHPTCFFPSWSRAHSSLNPLIHLSCIPPPDPSIPLLLWSPPPSPESTSIFSDSNTQSEPQQTSPITLSPIRTPIKSHPKSPSNGLVKNSGEKEQR